MEVGLNFTILIAWRLGAAGTTCLGLPDGQVTMSILSCDLLKPAFLRPDCA